MKGKMMVKKKIGINSIEDPTKKIKFKLKVKKDVPVDLDASHKPNASKAIVARREAKLIAAEAGVQAANAANHYERPTEVKARSKVHKDENGNDITPEQLEEYQKIIADYYREYNILDDSQQKDLASKIPKMIDHLEVAVGAKAVFPHILDQKRKRVGRAKIVAKMHRLKYISSDDRRGLQLAEEDAEELFNRYKLQAAAKKDLVRTLIALSYNDFEICDYLEIKGHELAKIKKEIFYEEIASHRQMTQEELFIQYRMQQMEVVKDMDVLVERFKDSQQLNALASILKSKAEIMDKIITKGQEFGVISKAAEKQAILIGNVDLADADMETLESELMKTNNDLSRIMKADASFLNDDISNEETG